MDSKNIIWLSENIKCRKTADKIALDLMLDVEYFFEYNKCYNYMINNKINLIVIEFLCEKQIYEITKFIRSLFKGIYIIILCYDDTIDKNSIIEKGADYVLNIQREETQLKFILGRCFERIINLRYDEEQKNYSCNGWTLNVISPAIISPNGTVLKITLTERDFLKVFFEHVGEECSFELIAGRLGIDPNEAYRHRIEVIIFRLRRKFKNSLFMDLPIHSIRGVGYLFEPVDMSPYKLSKPHFARA